MNLVRQSGFGLILIVMLIALGLGGGYLIYQNTKSTHSSPSSEQVACTQDAKLCPDGSYVSRTGPNCEFAVCPNESISQEQLIKIACAKQTGDDISKVDLRITTPSSDYSGKFAAGSYRTVDSAGGAIWLAAKVEEDWVCPAVGNGIANCSEVDPYNFPNKLASYCVDKDNQLIDRSTRRPVQ